MLWFAYYLKLKLILAIINSLVSKKCFKFREISLTPSLLPCPEHGTSTRGPYATHGASPGHPRPCKHRWQQTTNKLIAFSTHQPPPPAKQGKISIQILCYAGCNCALYAGFAGFMFWLLCVLIWLTHLNDSHQPGCCGSAAIGAWNKELRLRFAIFWY